MLGGWDARTLEGYDTVELGYRPNTRKGEVI